MKPISSIRSASSITKTSTSLRSMSFLSIKSISRPGVAISMSTGFESNLSLCFLKSIPPTTQSVDSSMYLLRSFESLSICSASSRVGARMRALGFPVSGASVLGDSQKRVNRVIRNAAVFPVPVCACPVIS